MRVAAFVLVCAAVLGSRPADACLCFKTPDLRQERDRADAVFYGRVVSVKTPPRLLVMLGLEMVGEVAFEVREVFKGQVGPAAVVLARGEETDCDISFAVGQDYVVYARKQDAGFAVGSKCSATGAVSADSRELQWLRTGEWPRVREAPGR